MGISLFTAGNSPFKSGGHLGQLRRFIKLGLTAGIEGIIIPNGDTHRSIWVWTKEAIDTTNEQSDFIDFCVAQGCDTVFADAYGWIGGASWDPVPLQQFIKSCGQAGITVYATWGNVDWGDPTVLSWVIANVVENYEEFQLLGDSTEQFSGMILDVEYWTDEVTYPPETNLPGLLDLVKNIQARSIECGLFSAFYLKDNTSSRTDVTYDSKSAQDGEHMMDVADFIVVGSYRDTASAQIATFKPWHDYAVGEGAFLYAGIETTDVSPSEITYFGDSKSAMEEEQSIVSTEYSGSSTYLGIAVHDYVGWAALED
jgi:hypothetical protein